MSLSVRCPLIPSMAIGLMVAILSLNFAEQAVYGATLKQQIFFDEEVSQNSLVFPLETLNFEQVVTEAFTINTTEQLLNALENIENPTSPKASLDWNRVAESFQELRIESPKFGQIAELEVLPQVSANNIMLGVYTFNLPNTASPNTDIFTFRDNQSLVSRQNTSLPSISVLNAPNSGLNLPFDQVMGVRGLEGLKLPTYGGINLLSPNIAGINAPRTGNQGFMAERGSIRQKFISLWQDNVDARWDLYPDEIKYKMPTDTIGSLDSNVQEMEQVFDLKIDVALKTMPENLLPTAMDIKDDYALTSPILDRSYARARLRVTEKNQDFVQKYTQENTQKLVESQQKYQKRIYERNRVLSQKRQSYP